MQTLVWKASYIYTILMSRSSELFFERYKNYKRFFDIAEGMAIKNDTHSFYCILPCIDPPVSTDLKYVRIYYDTPTFDRIKKDRAAKFVDMLSAIGGTMGLLTGFSIISGIEILYFAGISFINFMKKKIQ